MSEETKIIPAEETEMTAPVQTGNDFVDSFRKSYALARTLCQSNIIPQNYRGNVEDTAIAIDMANRIGVSPLMVMQNLYVVKGKPSWSGQSCITFIKNKYKNVKINYIGEKGTDDRGCYVSAVDENGEIIEGTTVTIDMAKAEGWYSKKDKYGNETSKWQTFPEQMLAYRAAAFFARVYCPEILMGCQVEGEAEDIASEKRIVEDVL